MKKLLYFCIVFGMMLAATACKDKMNKPVISASDSAFNDKSDVNDSTVYGVVSDGSAMHTLVLVTDNGDTLEYVVDPDDEASIVGGILEGDRMAVVGHKSGEENFADKAINLTSLMGKWTSLDKNFQIEEGGVVKSYIKAENNPWTSWKIVNCRLVLNRDTFDIDELGADSLYLENKNGIFTYKRAK